MEGEAVAGSCRGRLEFVCICVWHCTPLFEQAMQAFVVIGKEPHATPTQEPNFRSLYHNPAPLNVPDKPAAVLPLRKPTSRLGPRREIPNEDGTQRPITAPTYNAGRGRGNTLMQGGDEATAA